MIGAVLGDIIGSKWEFRTVNEYYKENMSLFDNDSFFTDDTVMYLATKYAIKNNIPYDETYRLFFNLYPDHTYGNMFKIWARSDNPKPYNSCGNGSAMRVGYIGEYFLSEEDVISEATISAKCTHNHPEGINGAVCTAMCTFYAKQNKGKTFIKDYIKSVHNYQLFNSMDELQEHTKYHFCEETCQETMPVVLSAFLLSNDWEDCMQKLLSVNCDTDTCCCIAGGIAENFYGVTTKNAKPLIKKYVKDKELRDLILRK